MKIRTLKSNTTSVLNNFLVANDSDKILEQFKLVWKSNRANGKCFENFCPQQTITIKFQSNQTIGATFVTADVIVNTNDGHKIFKESDNLNQVLKIKAEIVNTLSEKAMTFQMYQKIETAVLKRNRVIATVWKIFVRSKRWSNQTIGATFVMINYQ